VFLRNVGWLSADHMALYPEGRTICSDWGFPCAFLRPFWRVLGRWVT
jgi:hypothetical protein